LKLTLAVRRGLGDRRLLHARHGVGCHAEPPKMECAMPTGKNVTRQLRAA
jgi:hypothetical protein